MKTKNTLQKLAMASALLLCLIMPAMSKAQINYNINNNLSCDVLITYDIYDNSCNYVQSGATTIVRGTSQTVVIPFGCSDIYITVAWIDSPFCPATQSTGPVNINCNPVNASAGLTTSCANCNTANITAFATFANIN